MDHLRRLNLDVTLETPLLVLLRLLLQFLALLSLSCFPLKLLLNQIADARDPA
jgi:hypothetical protein